MPRLEVFFEIEKLKNRIVEIDKEMENGDFWLNAEKASKISEERSKCKKEVESFNDKEKKLADIDELITLAESDGDESIFKDINKDLSSLKSEISILKIKTFLSGKDDKKNAIISINSGAGGTEACDWAEILLRMYLRWSEKKGFVTKITDILAGEEAGLKNVTFIVEGEFAYGLLKGESGIHRLVRISPFDSNSRRHTSFASIFACPEVAEDIAIEINENDLRIDTYRAGGAGGQHVNKTDSAVRITHLPTNIVVQCQNERSQYKNKATAMKLLKSRLYQFEKEKRDQTEKESYSEKKDIAWGSQIRSYILQPYKLVKDHRFGFEVGNADAVLDGNIDGFIETYLLKS